MGGGRWWQQNHRQLRNALPAPILLKGELFFVVPRGGGGGTIVRWTWAAGAPAGCDPMAGGGFDGGAERSPGCTLKGL